MAQQLLNGAEVSAGREQVSGVGVAEAVRVDAGITGDHSGIEFHNAVRAASSQALAPVIQ